MVDAGEVVPDFTVPKADGELGTFQLYEAIQDGPIVLVFFPAAFSSTCTTELQTFSDRLKAFDAVNVRVFGVSVDSPYTLNAFHDAEALRFPLLSDFNREIITEYDLNTTLESPDLDNVAARAVLIVDTDRRLHWNWRAENPDEEPDYQRVLEAAQTA